MNYQLYEKKGALHFHVFAHPADTYTTSVSDSQKKHILEVAFLSIDTTASVEVLLIYIFLEKNNIHFITIYARVILAP